MAVSMLSLPVELQHQILESLDYLSQTNLRACNRRYRDLQAMTKKNLTSLLLELERTSAEAQPKHLFHHGFFPCYKCLRMRPRALYCSNFLVQRRCKLGKTRAAKRTCQECQPGHDADHQRRSQKCSLCYCWKNLHPGKMCIAIDKRNQLG
jgi:hypothetical protein